MALWLDTNDGSESVGDSRSTLSLQELAERVEVLETEAEAKEKVRAARLSHSNNFVPSMSCEAGTVACRLLKALPEGSYQTDVRKCAMMTPPGTCEQSPT